MEKNDVFISWQNDKESTSKKDKFQDLEAKAQRQLHVLQDNRWKRKQKKYSVIPILPPQRCFTVP